MAARRSVRKEMVHRFLALTALVAVSAGFGMFVVSRLGGCLEEIYQVQYPIVDAAARLRGAQAERLNALHALLAGRGEAQQRYTAAGEECARALSRLGELLAAGRSRERLEELEELDRRLAGAGEAVLARLAAARSAETEAAEAMKAMDRVLEELQAAMVSQGLGRERRDAVWRLIMPAHDFIITRGDPREKAAFEEMLGTVGAGLDRGALKGPYQKLVTRTREVFSRYEGHLAARREQEAALAQVMAVAAELEARTRAFTAAAEQRMSRATADADRLKTWSLVLLLAAALIAVGIALLGGLRLARRITLRLGEGVDVLAAAAGEISTSVSQLAASSTQTASALSETTATIEEVKQTSMLACEKARNVAERARQTVEVARMGEQAATQTGREIDQIRRQMEIVGDSIVKLSEQSQTIGEIISTVDDLSERRSRRAGNAAGEAAKAGEKGRGVAVVAQEIKNLAEQSKRATSRVRAILGEIQKATAHAVMATEQSSKAVHRGVVQANEAREAVSTLKESVSESAQAAAQIAATSQQQLAGVDQVTMAMESVKTASAQNMDSARQLETSASGLRELSEQLRRMIED